ncbi:ABC transporter permease [Oleisolibacter albus]|uniref:ABC transporter permease n=1 Tax=Oleisolibacter albus TaxID=2171757 RepID=UPI000DF3EF58|nr:ABC transporter permease [Oleisolibacter albus]
MTLLPLALRSLWNRRATALLTLLSVGLSVALLVGVESLRQGARASFERTITGTDLIVGARSGQLNLLLYAVFRVGDATNNITWPSYQAVAGRPDVAWTVPLSLGDSHRGFRVLGTTTDYFTHYRYGDGKSLTLAEGKPFADLFDAVIGAEVARTLGYTVGQEIVLSHGIGSVSFAEHSDRPFRVSGILAPTGTPVDRTVHVSLPAIEAIHVGWETGTRLSTSTSPSVDDLRHMELQPKQITAFLVGLKTRAAALRVQRAVNTYAEEPLLAIIPGVALSQLWSVLGVAEQALTAVAVFVVGVGLLGILISMLTSLNERRREMAVLRAIGARPWHVFALLVSESTLLALVGSTLGVTALHLGLLAGGSALEALAGLALLTPGPGLFDLAVIGGVTLAAALIGAVPAWRAYRVAVADGLSVQV